jgi:ABC-type siderophore export system fused ATPase/permease subunit
MVESLSHVSLISFVNVPLSANQESGEIMLWFAKKNLVLVMEKSFVTTSSIKSFQDLAVSRLKKRIAALNGLILYSALHLG